MLATNSAPPDDLTTAIPGPRAALDAADEADGYLAEVSRPAGNDGYSGAHTEDGRAAADGVRPQDRARVGDRVAQLEDAEPMVRGMCRSRLGYWDGDDAAQEALLSTWRAAQRPDFEDRGTLRPYAASAVRSFTGRADRWQAGSGVETRLPRPALAGDQAEWGDAWADPAAGPHEHIERSTAVADANARVAALLAGLSARQRDVVEAMSLDERDTDDVAYELGVTPSAARSAHVRAMARMREACGARSSNPLCRNRSQADLYRASRRDWERTRTAREHAEQRVIPRRASRHYAARIAAGQLDDPTSSDTQAAGPAAGSVGDPLARARAAVNRARWAVAAGQLDEQDQARAAQLAAWHHDDQQHRGAETADVADVADVTGVRA